MKRTTHSSTPTQTVKTSSYTPRDISKIHTNILYFLKNLTGKFSSSNDGTDFASNRKPSKKFKSIIPIALLVIIVGVVVIMSGKVLANATKKTNQDSRATIKGPKATMTINREFSYPLTDSKGKELTRFKYTIESAELRDEIVVKGSRATAITGRTFLILNIKIVNDYDRGLDINARDYVRLSINGDDSQLIAADIHNDPVNVQAISTKQTRLGFPINDTDKDLKLKIGEIKGSKEDINLNF